GLRDFPVTGVQTCALPILVIVLEYIFERAWNCCGAVGCALQAVTDDLRNLSIANPALQKAVDGHLVRSIQADARSLARTQRVEREPQAGEPVQIGLIEIE